MSVLIIGRHGQLARALIRQAAKTDSVAAVGRPDIDLEKPEAIEAEIARRKPSVIINAAAYTAVDRAEEESDRAFRVNAVGAEALARAASLAGAALVHISTDYVFDGEKSSPYVEDDEPSPRSAYGASKLEGERRVSRENPRSVILRTSWVYDTQGANFVRTMLRLAETRSEVNVVADQIGCPTFVRDLADAVLDIARRVERGGQHFGVYHCAGGGEASWYDLASEIFAQTRTLGGPSATARPIATSAYPTQARRPANSRLDCSKLAADYGLRLRCWRDALTACMSEIAVEDWSSRL